MISVYESLNGHASEVRHLAQRIRSSLGSIAEEAIDIGRSLIRAKQLLGHGQFERWLQEDVGLKKSNANNYMRVAETFGKCPLNGHLGLTVMVKLSSSDVPEEAIEEVKQRVSGGEKVTVKQVEEVIAEHRPSRPEQSRITENIEAVYGPSSPPVEPQDTARDAEEETLEETQEDRERAVRAKIMAMVGGLSESSRREVARELADLYGDKPSEPSEPECSCSGQAMLSGMEIDQEQLKAAISDSDKLQVARILFDACPTSQRRSLVGLMKSLLAKKAGRYSEEFEEFWAVYPPKRRTNKGAAYVAWNRAIDSLALVEPPEEDGSWASHLVRRASEYAASPVGQGRYVKGPEPWLNGCCWEDHKEAWKDNDYRNSALFVPGDEVKSGFV